MFTHVVVRTISGARYFFRVHEDRTYVSSTGSSSGTNLDNVVIDETSWTAQYGKATNSVSKGKRLEIRFPCTDDRVLTSVVEKVTVTEYLDNGRSNFYPSVIIASL